MAAAEIRAIDQETANATGAHLSEPDLLGWGGHAAIEARAGQAGNAAPIVSVSGGRYGHTAWSNRSATLATIFATQLRILAGI
jgi:hypothetical protein